MMVDDALRLEAHPVSALAFARGGRLLMTASNDHTVLVWDLDAWQLNRTGNE